MNKKKKTAPRTYLFRLYIATLYSKAPAVVLGMYVALAGIPAYYIKGNYACYYERGVFYA